MKTTFYASFFILLFLVAFTKPMEDESVYISKYIKYSVVREGSSALVTLDINNIQDYDEIYLRRSDNPTDNFRQIRYIDKGEIGAFSKIGTIEDKYPLPGNIDSYYKIIAISKDGTYKLFPCVKLSKY
jgi:hypothetical protein